MSDYIERESVLQILSGKNAPWDAYQKVKSIPAANVREVKWISVEERLPEDDFPVLVTYLGFHDHRPIANMLAYVDRDLGWCWWNDDIPDGTPCSVEVTHWMPLPEPPKEGE